MTAFAADKGHRIDLTLGRSHAQVELSGEIDMVTAPHLEHLFDSLQRIRSDIHINLAKV